MIRLLAWGVRQIFRPANDHENLRETIRILEEKLQQQTDGNQQTPLEPRGVPETTEPTDCFKKIGMVTNVHQDYFVIDGKYVVDNSLLKSAAHTSMDIDINTRIKFLAHRKTDATTGETTTRVIKIECVTDNVWANDEEAGESGWDNPSGVSQTRSAIGTTMYYNEHRRREPGKVIAKADNIVTVETDAGEPIMVNIDKTPLTFVPELGDYVTLDCVVQADQEFVDFKGEVLDVVGMKPTRVVSDVGTIVTVEPVGGEIRTADNGTFIYQTEYLSDDYRPVKGDRVSLRAIENEILRMRCISVKLVGAGSVPRSVPTIATQVKGENGNDLWADKHGIEIVGEFDLTVKSEECVVRKVTVRNGSTGQHKIIKIQAPLNKDAMVVLKSPAAYLQTILFPGESIEYTFEIKAGIFFGRNEEVFIWSFGGGFRIGRRFRVTVVAPAQDGHAAQDGAMAGQQTMSYCQKQLAMLNMRRAQAVNGEFIPGRGPAPRINFIAFRLPQYTVPSELFDLILNSSGRSELINVFERAPYNLHHELTVRNYQHIMRTLIYLEEIRQNINFRRHDIDRGNFTPEGLFLALDVANIAETRPSLMVGDSVLASTPWNDDNNTYQGVIHRVLHSRVLLKFDKSFHARYNGESYKLQFTFSRSLFRKQQHAIRRMQQTHGIEYLFPECIEPQRPMLNVRQNARGEMVLEEPTDNGLGNGSEKEATRGRVVPWQNPGLNHFQRQAIVNVLRGEARPLPHIIFGPPGTGKTMTIIELIHQLVLNVPSARLIVVTPSNSAAYLITERLAKGGVLAPGDFIRLVSMSQVEHEAIPEHLAQYCATVDVSDEQNTNGQVLVTESGLRMKYQSKHIGRHQVTISTCFGVGALMMMKFAPNHFTHVIIDEAGQAQEPEVLIPLVLVARKIGSVTLVGDPKQLGPMVHCEDVVKKKLAVSLLERLLDRRLYAADRRRFPETAGYDPRLVTLLRVNYRSIPSVLQLYNGLFYNGSLEAHEPTVSPADRELIGEMRKILNLPEERLSEEYGLFFCGVDGTNKQSPDSPSWFNPAEACQVHKIVERLYRGNRYGPADIGIITPYVMQVQTIRRIFQAAGLESPKIGSIEEFQGQERRVVIVSTVRSAIHHLQQDASNRLGFIAEPKRINVAISRAKSALVIVGNPKLLCIDQIWARLMQQALDKGTYCGCTLSRALLTALSSKLADDANGNVLDDA